LVSQEKEFHKKMGKGSEWYAVPMATAVQHVAVWLEANGLPATTQPMDSVKPRGRPLLGQPISIVLTPEQRDWLDAQIPPGGTRTEVVRQIIQLAMDRRYDKLHKRFGSGA
jgi:hypothetical protein